MSIARRLALAALTSGLLLTAAVRPARAEGPSAVQHRQWVDTSHWETVRTWVDTSHWETRLVWVDTSRWVERRVWVPEVRRETRMVWVDTSHWETRTRWEVVERRVEEYRAVYRGLVRETWAWREWVRSGHWVTIPVWVQSGHWRTDWVWVRSGHYAWTPHRHSYVWHHPHVRWAWWCWCLQTWSHPHEVAWTHWHRVWVDTSHWEARRRWVDTSHWEYRRQWVDTSHWEERRQTIEAHPVFAGPWSSSRAAALSYRPPRIGIGITSRPNPDAILVNAHINQPNWYPPVLEPRTRTLQERILREERVWVSSGYWKTETVLIPGGRWVTEREWIRDGYYRQERVWVEDGRWSESSVWVPSGHWTEWSAGEGPYAPVAGPAATLRWADGGTIRAAGAVRWLVRRAADVRLEAELRDSMADCASRLAQVQYEGRALEAGSFLSRFDRERDWRQPSTDRIPYRVLVESECPSGRYETLFELELPVELGYLAIET